MPWWAKVHRSVEGCGLKLMGKSHLKHCPGRLVVVMVDDFRSIPGWTEQGDHKVMEEQGVPLEPYR